MNTDVRNGPWLGIDWGSSHRRAWRYDAGALTATHADDQGLLRCAPDFAGSMARLLQALHVDGRACTVVMSGMVGSASGWQEVPYLDAGRSLRELPRRLARLTRPDAPPDAWIVPGVCWRDGQGSVDVMRGEETQLLGALQLLDGRADGIYLLPGTHSKWVRLQHGCVQWMRTYLSGELFALLRESGTLSAIMRNDAPLPDAFDRGVAASGTAALSHALFAARARVVTGTMPKDSAAAFVSGALFGAEWHDIARQPGLDGPVRIIGDAALAAHHARCAAALGREVELLDIQAVQQAGWQALRMGTDR